MIVAFIDPLCRDFCPREATVLTDASAQLGGMVPAIVSVSVDPWGDNATNFSSDKIHWRLTTAWHWATGSYSKLAKVWRAYEVGVQVRRKTVAGISVREISHTGAAYLIDAAGNERALFLFPFTTAGLIAAAKHALARDARRLSGETSPRVP